MKKILNFILSRFVITVLLVLLQLAFMIFEILRLQHYYILFSVILMILSWIVVIYLLCKPYNPSIKLAWIVPILAFPLLGGLIYILYGHVVIPKKLKKNMERVYSDSRSYQVSDQDNRKQMTEVEQSVGELFYYAEKYAGAFIIILNAEQSFITPGPENS